MQTNKERAALVIIFQAIRSTGLLAKYPNIKVIFPDQPVPSTGTVLQITKIWELPVLVEGVLWR